MTHSPEANKSRDKRLLLGAAVLFTVALIGFGSFYRLQNQSVNARPGMITGVDDRGRRWGATPDIPDEEKLQFIDRAKFLREKYRPWAQSHADMIRKMRTGDQAAFQKVWNEIPAFPLEIGFKPEDLMPSNNPLVGVGFGYAPLSKRVTVPTRLKNDPMMQKIARAAPSRALAEFASHQDVVLAGGFKGRTETILWMSGRITQRRKLLPPERIAALRKIKEDGRQWADDDLYTPHKNIVSAFEFATNPSSK